MKEGILFSTPDLRPSLASLLKGLEEESLLKEVATTVAVDPRALFGIAGRFLPRRTLPAFLSGKVKTFAFREVVRILAHRFLSQTAAHRVWFWAERGFDEKVAGKFSGKYRFIYGMENSSLETFRVQKEKNGFCILRQVMAHGREVARVLKMTMQKFSNELDAYERLLLNDLDGFLARKEAEYAAADLIVANSYFVRKTFLDAGVGAEKVEAVPTGCPPCSRTPANAGRGNEPLIFLFAGTLSFRKGVHALLEAWRSFEGNKHAELWLVGRSELPGIFLKDIADNIKLIPALSRKGLSATYQKADVLVLPTLLEGLAHVVLEALSQGLPIVTTEESGCGDLVEDKQNGLKIKPADTQALVEALSWCLENRDRLPAMGGASLDRARAWTVEDSNRAHIEIIKNFLKRF